MSIHIIRQKHLDSPLCWCVPQALRMCWYCDGVGSKFNGLLTCDLCHGETWIDARYPEEATLVVHRRTTESPYDYEWI